MPTNNPEYMKEYMRKYIKKKSNTITCECGKQYKEYYKNKHKKTQFHKLYEQTNKKKFNELGNLNNHSLEIEKILLEEEIRKKRYEVRNINMKILGIWDYYQGYKACYKSINS